VAAKANEYAGTEEQTVLITVGVTLEDVNFVLSEGAIVEGKVLDSDGNPVVDARVKARDRERDRHDALTDEEGAFVLRGFEPGEITIEVKTEEFLDHKETVTTPASGIEIKLQRGCKITGRVVNKADGTPVTRFKLTHRTETSSRSSTKDYPEGRFELSGLKPGTYSITVEAEDCAPATVEDITVEEGVETEEVVIEVGVGASVLFRVTSAADGQPVKGAAVFREESRSGRRAVNYDNVDVAAVTGEDGTCTVEHLGPLRGRVVSKADQLPVQGATVSQRKGDQRMWSGPSQDEASQAETDEAGAFALEHLAPGRYVLTIEHLDYAPAEQKVRLREGSNKELLIELGSGGRIVGTVTTADGSPVAGAQIYVRGGMMSMPEAVLTDAQGNYEIAGVPPGSYTVMLMPQGMGGGGSAGGSVEIKQAAVREGAEERVDFVLGGGAAVFGTVTRNGQPVVGAQTIAMLKGTTFITMTGSVGSATTGKQGEYRIEDLAPGVYQLWIMLEEENGSKRIVREVEIGTQDVQFDIALGGGGAVSGMVFDSTGSPVEAADIALRPAVGAQDPLEAVNAMVTSMGDAAKTDTLGAFQLTDLSPGSYHVLVSKQGYATQVVPLEYAGGYVSGVRVQLQPELAITARAKTTDGSIPSEMMVMIADEQGRMIKMDQVSIDVDSGEFQIGGLGPGRFRITALTPSTSRRAVTSP
jgi:hypothetical protein